MSGAAIVENRGLRMESTDPDAFVQLVTDVFVGQVRPAYVEATNAPHRPQVKPDAGRKV